MKYAESLTKEIRHKIYKYALHEVNHSEPFNPTPDEMCIGLCSAFGSAFISLESIDDIYIDWNVSIEMFPEIVKHQPDSKIIRWLGGYWWPLNEAGLQKRVQVLEQAIKETES